MWKLCFLVYLGQTIKGKAIANHPTGLHSFLRWFLPWLGVSELEKTLVNFSAVIEKIENYTVDAIQAFQVEVSSLSKMVLQNRMALDMLPAPQGGVCTAINTSCCVYIDQTGRITTDLEETWKQTQQIHRVAMDDTSWGFEEIWDKLTSWLPRLKWLKQMFVIITLIIIVSITACVLLYCCKWITNQVF